MKFQTIDHWDAALWEKAEIVYHEAFPEHGRKNRTIIQRMFERKLCFLHLLFDQDTCVAMAITSMIDDRNALLIDYLAVQKEQQHKGIGQEFLEQIKHWALHEKQMAGMIIEVESEPTPKNLQRIHFWKKCGFHLTDYVHHYIWVPEPYQAMYLIFNTSLPHTIPKDGQALFDSITTFHGKAYRGGK